jgi:hypothetical protein
VEYGRRFYRRKEGRRPARDDGSVTGMEIGRR